MDEPNDVREGGAALTPAPHFDEVASERDFSLEFKSVMPWGSQARPAPVGPQSRRPGEGALGLAAVSSLRRQLEQMANHVAKTLSALDAALEQTETALEEMRYDLREHLFEIRQRPKQRRAERIEG
jgi:hypothetical protein